MNEHQTGGRYDSTRAAWETIWNGANMRVELEAVQSARAQATIQAYLPYLQKQDLLIEAGSGLSAVVLTLREMGYQIVGLDYAVNALQISREYEPTLQLLAGDVHALPHPDNTFGGYLSFGVLEHFEHGLLPALREAYRVIKPGGVIVLTIPYPNLVYKLVHWKRKLSGGSYLTNDEFYESTYTRSVLVQNVQQVGFDVVEVMPTSHSFTLWGLGRPFRAEGYYRTSALAEVVGGILKRIMPWTFNYMTLIVGRK